MTHIKRINEFFNGSNEFDKLMKCDTVRLDLWSRTFACKFKGKKVESLAETNGYIFGKTVDKFTGDNVEITWDLNINTGNIDGWDSGYVDIHFKVVDGGIYTLMKNGKPIIKKENEYVPFFLQINENGYNDYIKITIDETGHVVGWNEKRKKQVVSFFCGDELTINEID